MASNLSGLQIQDYDLIKEDLKEFLKAYPGFDGYNFEGSALSMIVALLAYNAEKTAFTQNMTFAETFLKTAQLRSNVVLRARELGYTPGTYSAPSATLTVSFTRPDLTAPLPAVTIDKGTKFTTLVDGKSYFFSTIQPYTVYPDDNGKYTQQIDVYQGSFVDYVFQVTDASVRNYTLPVQNIDGRFLTVSVKDTLASTSEKIFTRAHDVTLLDNTSEVYFFEENTDGNWDIVFGDGIIGKALSVGNVITAQAFITAGPDANLAASFSRASTVGGASAVTVTVNSVAAGGDVKESIESIRLLAPLEYQAQSRAATVNDYVTLIKRTYKDLDDVAVWGGEDNLPTPYYGKVFIAIKPKENVYLSNVTKERIKRDIISSYNIVSIRPEIVDPEYIFVEVDTSVTFDNKQTSLSASQINTKARTAIIDFFDKNLNLFGRKLQFSKLGSAIDNCDPSVLSSNTVLKIRQERKISPDAVVNYEFSMSNAIEPFSVKSNALVIDDITYYIGDEPNGAAPYTTGNLVVYRLNSHGVKVYLKRNQGTVNYVTGEMLFSGLRITSTSDSMLKITVTPAKSLNLVAVSAVDYNINVNKRQQIITLNTADITTRTVAENSNRII